MLVMTLGRGSLLVSPVQGLAHSRGAINICRRKHGDRGKISISKVGGKLARLCLILTR